MRPIFLAPLLLLPLLSTGQARTLTEIRASGVLRLATSADYEPFNFMQDGQFAGFEVELGNLLAKQMNVKAVWVKHPFDTLLNDFKSGEYDVVIAAHAITSTRAKIVDFTNPHSCGGNVLLAKSGGPLTSKALEGRRIGAESGSINLGFLQKLPFQKQIEVYRTSDLAIRSVALGEVDAVLVDRLGAVKALETYSKAGLTIGETLWSTSSGIAVEKGNTGLRSALNVALAKVLKDGSYAATSQKFFKTDIRC
jgi:polar amino acid transport system substrate-binding protein